MTTRSSLGAAYGRPGPEPGSNEWGGEQPAMRIGPLDVRHWLQRGERVRHGPLVIVPVARVTEVRWRQPQRTRGLTRAAPHHVIVHTLAGDQRIWIEPPGGWWPLLALPPVLLLVIRNLLNRGKRGDAR